jgi:hypothetical protein
MINLTQRISLGVVFIILVLSLFPAIPRVLSQEKGDTVIIDIVAA